MYILITEAKIYLDVFKSNIDPELFAKYDKEADEKFNEWAKDQASALFEFTEPEVEAALKP
jgi:hypothetical protein